MIMRMKEHGIDAAFAELIGPLDEEIKAQQKEARRGAFSIESRPLPEGLIPPGLAAGHIALRGDFDAPPSQQ